MSTIIEQQTTLGIGAPEALLQGVQAGFQQLLTSGRLELT